MSSQLRERSNSHCKARYRNQQTPEKYSVCGYQFSANKHHEDPYNIAAQTKLPEGRQEPIFGLNLGDWEFMDFGRSSSGSSTSSTFSHCTRDNLENSVLTTRTEFDDIGRCSSRQVAEYTENDCYPRRNAHAEPGKTRIRSSDKHKNARHKAGVGSASDQKGANESPEVPHCEESPAPSASIEEMEDAFSQGSTVIDPAWKHDSELEEKDTPDPFWEWDGHNFRHREKDGNYIYFPDHLR